MIDVLRIAHLRIAPQEGNLEVGNCEGNRLIHYQGLVNLLALKLSEASSAMQGYFHFQEI